MKNLQDKSIKELTTIYNDIATKNNINTIKKFSDKKSAYRRIEKILKEFPEAPKAPEAEPESFTGEITKHTEGYMEEKLDKGIRKATDRTIAYRGISYYPLNKKWRAKAPIMELNEETGTEEKKYFNLCFLEDPKEAAMERDNYIRDNMELCSRMKLNFPEQDFRK